MTISRFHAGHRMSQGVLCGNIFVTSAQVASDLDMDISGQTKDVLKKIENLLGEVGYNKSNIFSATIWLSNIDEYPEVNDVWDAWILKDAPPARACIETRFSSPRIKVEIQIMAGA